MGQCVRTAARVRRASPDGPIRGPFYDNGQAPVGRDVRSTHDNILSCPPPGFGLGVRNDRSFDHRTACTEALASKISGGDGGAGDVAFFRLDMPYPKAKPRTLSLYQAALRRPRSPAQCRTSAGASTTSAATWPSEADPLPSCAGAAGGDGAVPNRWIT
jgi:hypothetical protein